MSVHVVGGGIAGLSAAHALSTGGIDVVLHEAGDRLGGKIRTTPFAAHPGIDEGPDAFLARVPWATALARATGLGGDLVSPSSGMASVWWNGLHPIPGGLLLGMPTDLLALARSPLLPLSGKLRAAIEPLLRRTSTAPDSLGGYVRARFGDAVHERLVDPLVGSIYAADTDRFSLAAVPQIADLAATSRSVLLAGRRRSSVPEGPVFYAPRTGMGALVTAVGDAASAAGAEIRHGSRVQSLEADGELWRVDGEPAEAVVLACPAAAAALLLGKYDAAGGLRSIQAADIAMVTAAVPAGSLPGTVAGQSGYLVPKPVQHRVTAVSFGSQKWPHWTLPGGDAVLRISLGRDGLEVLQDDDDELLAAALGDTSRHLGVTLRPTAVRISRWEGAFPQYRPHHADLVAGIDRALPAGVVICGASYHGIGVPACVRSGSDAAAAVHIRLAQLAE